jgi:hypothetical protein
MRYQLKLWLALAVLAGFARPGHADSEAEALLAKAVRAHGGAEALNRYAGVRLRLKVQDEGARVGPYDWELLFAAPDKLRDFRESYYLGRRTSDSGWVTNGKQTWWVAERRAVPAEEPAATSIRADAHLMQALRLVPLRGKDYELRVADEVTVDGKPAAGLLVRTAGHKDVTLFFDKETGLLVKVERPVYDAGPEKEVKEERFYRDYSRGAALPVARKWVVLHGGKKVWQAVIKDARFLEKVGDKEFNP